LFKFEQRDSQLIVRSKLEDLEDETRIVITGDASVMTYRPMGDRVPNEPRDFNFIQQDFSGPAGSQTITTVILAAGRLTLARESENGAGTRSVQLLEDPPPPPDAVPNPDEPPVRLYISKQDASGTPDVQVKRTAQSFRELCLKFPDDINQHVRPILRGLKQESAVFAPDSKLAWQVLSQDWTAPTQLEEKVNALVQKLDATDFQSRSDALAALKDLGQPAANILIRGDHSKLSAEQQSAVDSMLEPYVLISSDEVKKLRDDITFLTDTLSSDDVELRKLAWQRIKSLTNTELEFDPAATDATRIEVIQKLRQSARK
jgi:hypothetical protein